MAGKKTQTKLLIEGLIKHGYPIRTMSFPRYHTPTGQKVREYLSGKDERAKSDPLRAIQLYADDRLAAVPEIRDWLQKGGVWVFDRYYESNLAHQGGKFSDPAKRLEIIQYILDLEMIKMGIPQSNFVLYLSLPLEYMLEAKRNDASRNGIKDLHEDDPQHLKNAKETYDLLAQNLHWMTIHCVPPHGKERYSIEQIQKWMLEMSLAYLEHNYEIPVPAPV